MSERQADGDRERQAERERRGAHPERRRPRAGDVDFHNVTVIWLGREEQLWPRVQRHEGPNCHTKSSTTMLQVRRPRLDPPPQAAARRGIGALSSSNIAFELWVSATCVFSLGLFCPARHGNAARSAQRMPCSGITAITVTGVGCNRRRDRWRILAEARDGKTDAFGRGEELANQDADQRAADGESSTATTYRRTPARKDEPCDKGPTRHRRANARR